MSGSGNGGQERGLVAAYDALWLMPGAPQELVVDTYWHLVQRILQNAPSDAQAQGELAVLNQAYALVTSSDTPRVEPVQEKPRRGRTPLRHKLLKRGAMRPVARSPWEVLQVHPSAPPDVIELAYQFWQVRLRNAWYDSTGTQRESLDEAYASLRNLSSNQPAVADKIEHPADVPHAAVAASPESAPPPIEETPAPASIETPAPQEPEVERTATPAVSHIDPPAPIRNVQVKAPAAQVTHADVGEASAPPQERAPTPITKRHTGSPHEHRPAKESPAASAQPSVTQEEATPDAESLPIAVGDHSRQSSSSAPTPIREDPLAQALRRGAQPSVTASGTPDRARPAAPPAPDAASASPALPHIVFEGGGAARQHVEIGPTPVHITADNGHVEVSSQDTKGLVARIWSLRDEVMFHAVATETVCRVNGREVTWAVLEDGDTIQVGEDLLRFRRNGR